MGKDCKITIITPTTGRSSLYRLFDSLESQSIDWVHILLWDSKREGDFLFPNLETYKVSHPSDLACLTQRGIRYCIDIPGYMVKGKAAGSALRAVGLMAANTPYVTFADDDVWYENNHLETLMNVVDGKNWGYCRRNIWANKDECLGVDNFESVGDSADRKVPYEMVDNNSMIFSRRFGSSASVLYRETEDYNDDRLMYDFLKKHAGDPGKTKKATVNQICPSRLEKMFRSNCDLS